LTTRSDKKLPIEVTSSDYITRYTLGPLPLPDCVSVACLKIGAYSVRNDDPASAVIKKRCQGNPLFAEELAQSMLEAGYIKITDGVLTVEKDLDLFEGLPESVTGVINSKLDQLDPSTQMVLKVASVIGLEFGKDSLVDVYPIEEMKKRISSFLKQLVRLGFLERKHKKIYAFRDPMVHQVAYNRMLYNQRQKLHEIIANWYEYNAHEYTKRTTQLAYHCIKILEANKEVDITQILKTFRYIDKAAEDSTHRGDPEETLQWYKRGLYLLGVLKDFPEKPAISERMHSKISALKLAQAGSGAATSMLALPKIS